MADTYIQSRHDIGVVDVGSNGGGADLIGMMLALKEDGSPAYEEYDGDFLVTQYATGSPSLVNMNPEEELPLFQNSWHAGFGSEYYDTALKYYRSIGMDLRHKGRALLGWTPGSITLPAITSVSITNADMELDANWLTESGTPGRDNAQALSGTYSWRVSGDEVAYQNMTWNDNHKGHTFRFICWVWANAASVRIAIDDGDTTTYSDYHAGDSAWAQLTVDKTIGSGATKLALELIEDASGTGYFDDAEIWAPVAGTIKAMKQFGDNQYFGIGNELYKLNGAGDGFTSLHIFPTAIVALEVFASHLYIALEDGFVFEDCEDAWVAKNNVTSTLDTGDYIVGSGSSKNVIASGLAVNQLIATEDFSALNMSSACGIEFWIKCSKTLSSGDLKLYLSDSSAAASETEAIVIPALTAGKWDRVHIDLAAPEDDTAIISVGLYQATDIGAETVHIDNIKLTYKTWYMTGGETFTQSTIVYAYARFFAVVHGTAPALYLGVKPNEIRKSTDPTNDGSWGTITEIGDHTADITKILEWQGLLYIMKGDYPYYIDSSGNVQDDVAHELEGEQSTTSGKNAIVYLNKFYTQAGDQTLLEITTGGVNTFRSPADYITNDSNFTGQIFALAHDTFYLYAITDNSDKIEIIAMRSEIINGVSTWVVHPIQEITLAGCETAYVSTVVQKRMWISSTSSSDALYYLPLPATYGNIESDANASFKTGGYFETPWLHGDFRSENKAWIKITLTMGHTYNADDYFTVKYKKLGDSDWTTIGDFAGSATSMIQTKYIDTTGKPFTSMMKFQFTGVTGSTSRTPVLLNYDIRAVMYPPIRRLIHCVVRCADEILTNEDGMIDENMFDRISATLDNARNNAKWAIPIKDIVGKDLNVKFLPVPRSLQRMMPTTKEKGRHNQEREYHILMLEIPSS